jgi:hypothetical protein
VYPWIWRRLPGPRPVKALVALLLVAAVVLVLFQFGFSHLAPYMPFNDGTVSQ